MTTKEKVMEINSLNLKKIKKTFNLYLDNTKNNIDKADSPLDVIQHVQNLGYVITRDVGKMIH